MSFGQAMEIANFLSPILLGAIGWLVKAALGRVTDRLDSQDRRQDKAERRADELEQAVDELRASTVKREDWIRESTRMNLKLDRLLESLARLEGKVDVSAPLAVALRDLRTELARGDEDAN